MSNTIIKGKIEDCERFEKYDDDGIKFIQYWIKVHSKKYTVQFSKGTDFYFDTNVEVVLYVNENNVAIAGLCPKKSIKWGNTKPINNEVQESDRFELAEGIVLEKQKESITSYTGTSIYYSNTRKTVTYTIVLPEKRFRVHETIGKYIKPNTDIIALTENGAGYLIKDNTNNKIYGKPGKGYIIAIVLWLAFNLAMIIAASSDKKDIFVSYNTTLIIGNIVFGISFLFSFTAFLSSSKTLKVFNQMIQERR